MAVFNSVHPRSGSDMSVAQLKRFMPGRGAAHDFLRHLCRRDVVDYFDDFLGDTIDLDMYAVAKAGGTADANFAIAVAANGTIAGTTGTDDNNSHSLVGPLIYYGDNNAGMEVRLKLDVVTSYNLEVGFIDAVPGSSASGVSDVDTPAAAFSDGALIQIDTDQTLATLASVTKGSTAGQGIVATTFAAPAATVLTAATYATLRVQLIGNSAFFWINGVLAASHDADPQGNLEGGVALAPWIYVRTRNTTAKVATVDYIWTWADRA